MRFESIARALVFFGMTMLATGTGWLQGAVIPNRAALQTLLGGPGTLENFESYDISFGSADNLGNSILNSTTVINGQGPGLVIPGVSFFLTNGLQWNGSGYFGSPSKEILANGIGAILAVDFASPTQAFGINLRAFTGYGDVATLRVFGSDDTTLIDTISGISLPGSGAPIFAGYGSVGGIGRIELLGSINPWSANIDDLEFGMQANSSVPEPMSLFVWGAGVYGVTFATRRRRNAR